MMQGLKHVRDLQSERRTSFLFLQAKRSAALFFGLLQVGCVK